MRLYKDFEFRSFEPWSGAVETYNRIEAEGKGEALEAILDEIYPDGMTETGLNDLLWFEPDTVYEWLGISDEEEEPEEEAGELTDPAAYSVFDEFCQDCDCCPFDKVCKTQEECKKRFEELKGGAA